MQNNSCKLLDPGLPIKAALGLHAKPFGWLEPTGPMGFVFKWLEMLHQVYGFSMEYHWHNSVMAGYCSSNTNCSGLLGNLLSGDVDILPHVSVDEARMKYASFR